MAIRSLLGILEDGSNPDKTLPSTARRTLKMTQGSTLQVVLEIVRENGVPVILADDPTATLVLTVKKTSLLQNAIISVNGSITPTTGVNKATFSIDPTATKYVEPGRYVYDVWLTFDGSRDVVVPFSPFHLEPGLSLP